mmetsp:Transcript_3689/g.8255  ORF Transcript_3689/g.8255 Transcript_3689/m.8255 type:complete len:135 (+) Transcript_3689:93-497(+)
MSGRGHPRGSSEAHEDREVQEDDAESIHHRGSGPQKSVEGWIVFVTGVHEEAQEDDLVDAFAEYGAVKNIHVNLDRRTGFVKGYALVEYATSTEAQDAINALHGKDLLGKKVGVDWAFVQPTNHGTGHQGRRKR